MGVNNSSIVQWYNENGAYFSTFRIPRAHDDPSAIGLGFDQLDYFGELIHPFTSVVGMGAVVLSTEMSPLEAVDGSEVPFLTLVEAVRIEKFT